ncbi:MAG: VWA domain-containing protein [Vicinamibacterales bacterium]
MPRTSLVVVAIALWALSGEAQQPQPFTASSDLIVVPAVVVDKKGALIPGLTQSDFQIFEDGKPVPIETFVTAAPVAAGTEAGRFIVIVLDNLTTPPEIAYRVKDIARKFVDRMGPADVATVIMLNGGNSASTNLPGSVRAAIDRFRPAIGDMPMDEFPGRAAEHGLTMVSSLARQMNKSAHPRKVMVFIGKPAIFSPSEPSAFGNLETGDPTKPDMNNAWFQAIRDTGRNNVTVFAIDPTGQTGNFTDWDKSFAAETGGNAWSNTNNFNGAVDRIWQESGHYYLLGYAPPINDHRVHKIEVRVNAPGATVRARRARG